MRNLYVNSTNRLDDYVYVFVTYNYKFMTVNLIVVIVVKQLIVIPSVLMNRAKDQSYPNQRFKFNATPTIDS